MPIETMSQQSVSRFINLISNTSVDKSIDFAHTKKKSEKNLLAFSEILRQTNCSTTKARSWSLEVGMMKNHVFQPSSLPGWVFSYIMDMCMPCLLTEERADIR